MKHTSVGIGMVGYGGIGRMHALCYRMLPLVYPTLQPPPKLVGVVTGPTSVERARRELDDVVVMAQLEELLARDDVAVIDCCTPTADHVRVAAATLEAGKALFCEKPLAATGAEARQIAALARSRGLAGGVNYHFRSLPAFQETRRRIDAGLLGTVTGFQLHYYRASNLRRDRPLTWRSSGPGSGVLLDLGAHLVDLVLALLGPVTTVQARTRTLVAERPGADGRLAPVEADDVAWLALELVDGGFGTLEASKMVPSAADDLRFEAYGSAGTLVVDTREPNGLWVGEMGDVGLRQVPVLNRAEPAPSLPGPETPTGVLQWHLASIAAFLEALARGSAPPCDLESAAQVQLVLDAALQSAAAGGTTTRLDQVPLD